MITLTGQVGDWCLRTDVEIAYIITSGTGANTADWQRVSSPGSEVDSVNGQVGTIVLGSHADVGAASAAQGQTADDLVSLSGVLNGALHLGAFDGATIPDDQTIKQLPSTLLSCPGTGNR